MRGRCGFTLIEVLVALVLTGIVVAAAYQIFGVAIDTGVRLDATGIAHARESNARRWVSSALGSVDVSRDTGGEFMGASRRMEFTTWLLTKNGWFESARLSIEEWDGGVVGRTGAPIAIMLFPEYRLVGIDYLGRLGEDSPWLTGWESAITAPRAVRIRLAGKSTIDTLLLRVGERG